MGETAKLTTTGFEPAPVKIGALIQRLRPLGHVVMSQCTVNTVIFNYCMETLEKRENFSDLPPSLPPTHII